MDSKNTLLLLGGGEGTRFLSPHKKILYQVRGYPIFAFSAYNFCSVILEWHSVLVVCSLEERALFMDFFQKKIPHVVSKIQFFIPGNTRFASVWNAIKDRVALDQERIWIHDLARPCVAVEDIKSLHQLSMVEENLPLIPGKVVTDSLKKIAKSSSSNGEAVVKIQSSVCRKEFVRVSTPQIFVLSKLQAAYAACDDHWESYADDERVYAQKFSNEKSTLFFCNYPNPKLTFLADVVTITGFLKNHPLEMIK